jgi:hypothetical protein
MAGVCYGGEGKKKEVVQEEHGAFQDELEYETKCSAMFLLGCDLGSANKRYNLNCHYSCCYMLNRNHCSMQ